jgi:hypothetical protein
MMDYIGLTIRNLGHVSSNSIDHPLKAMSCVLALFFLSCITLEITNAFSQANILYLKDKSMMTPVEKDLKDVYYSGLDKESVKASWWIRNYNITFMVRFMIIVLLAYTL